MQITWIFIAHLAFVYTKLYFQISSYETKKNIPCLCVSVEAEIEQHDKIIMDLHINVNMLRSSIVVYTCGNIRSVNVNFSVAFVGA